MAKTNNIITSSFKGAIGNDLVFRTRNGKTFASKYPDMSNVKRTPKQEKETSKFAKAVAFAQSIIKNPAKKGSIKVKKGQSLYHAAIQDYLKNHK